MQRSSSSSSAVPPGRSGSTSSDGTSEITSTGHTSAHSAHSTHLSTSRRMLAKQRRQRFASHRACCSVKPSSTSASPIRRPVSSVGTSTRAYPVVQSRRAGGTGRACTIVRRRAVARRRHRTTRWMSAADAAPVGDGVDQGAWSLGGVAARPDVGHRRAAGVVVDLDRAARADLGAGRRRARRGRSPGRSPG